MEYELSSPTIKAVSGALIQANLQINAITHDKENPYFKSSYASLTVILETLRPILATEGLVVTQQMLPYEVQGGFILVTTLMHSSGEWIRSYMPVVPTKKDSQGVASAITYMRRYCLSALLAVSTEEDDDGNAAQKLGNIMPAQENPTIKLGGIPKIICITKEQYIELQIEINKIEQGDIPDFVNRVLAYYKIEKFSSLPATAFKTVMEKAVKKATFV